MLFIPKEIKEKIAKIENENLQLQAENDSLKQQLSAPVAQKKKSVAPGILLGLLLLALCYIAFLHWQGRNNSTQNNTAETEESVLIKDGEIVKWDGLADKEIVYRVQLGAYQNFNIERYTQNLEGLQQDSIDGFRRVSLGAFSRLSDAQEFLKSMLRMGLQNVYIVAYKNNEPIGLIQAKREEQ